MLELLYWFLIGLGIGVAIRLIVKDVIENAINEKERDNNENNK